MSKIKRDVYMRMSELADELGIHPRMIERCIYRGVITPDAEITHGRSLQPLFLVERKPELVEAIRRYREQGELVTQ